jgi:hypothetical protein
MKVDQAIAENWISGYSAMLLKDVGAPEKGSVNFVEIIISDSQLESPCHADEARHPGVPPFKTKVPRLRSG